MPGYRRRDDLFELATLLAGLLDGAIPPQPVRLPWHH